MFENGRVPAKLAPMFYGGLKDELVPKPERGKHNIDMFLDIVCLPENNCFGVKSDWENVSIYRNSGKAGPHYSKIAWKRKECSE